MTLTQTLNNLATVTWFWLKHHHLTLTQTLNDLATVTWFWHKHHPLILTQTLNDLATVTWFWHKHHHLILTQTLNNLATVIWFWHKHHHLILTNTEWFGHHCLILRQTRNTLAIITWFWHKHGTILPLSFDFDTNMEGFCPHYLIPTQSALSPCCFQHFPPQFMKKGMLKPFSAPHHKHFVLRLTSTLATPRSPCVTANQHAGNTTQPLCYS